MYQVRLYTLADLDIWNEFIRASKNGTFLFDRDYMDYHSDRFLDYSLIILAQGRVVALLPANRIDTKVLSHGGLTYGGVVVDQKMTTSRMLEVFKAITEFLRQQGIEELEYKTVPSIYHRAPAQEDLYALFRLNARLHRRDVLSIVDYAGRVEMQERRLRGLKRAEKKDIAFMESSRWSDFWQVLNENLSERYARQPAHSLDEIVLLKNRFPEQIRLFVAEHQNQVVAGAVMYCASPVAHVQYIACNGAGREQNALDLLFIRLIQEFNSYSKFDFGISTEQNGHYLNEGLVEFKEGFGARAYMHDHYSLSLNQRT
jgi:hypothetical protein